MKRSSRVCRKRRTFFSLLYSLCRETLRCRRVRIYKLCAPQAIRPLVPFEQTRFDSILFVAVAHAQSHAHVSSVSSSVRSLDARYTVQSARGDNERGAAVPVPVSRRSPFRSRSARARNRRRDRPREGRSRGCWFQWYKI